jgi:hypothetical protein
MSFKFLRFCIIGQESKGSKKTFPIALVACRRRENSAVDITLGTRPFYFIAEEMNRGQRVVGQDMSWGSRNRRESTGGYSFVGLGTV